MVGRYRKDPTNCVKRKAGAPSGYSSIHAAREAERATARSAARLRALVAEHGASIPMDWSGNELNAHLRSKGDTAGTVSRVLCRSWEARGWAHVRHIDRRRVRLEVDLGALPEPEEGGPLATPGGQG